MTSQSFQVSVIIPVFNVDKYIRKAVESAVFLTEVVEVVLVEDNSSDNSLEICRQLEKEYEKVILLRHFDKGNHGPGASRNLGIKKASCDYIAFLDADDYYLPNRFTKDKEILLKDNSIDGVYNALGNHYYSEEGKKVYLEGGHPELMTVSGQVPPNELIYVLFWSHPRYKGEFSTDTITVRKELFERVGLFNTQLRLRQDIHMWKRMAAMGSLAPGSIKEPVAMRGIHDRNRMINKVEQKKYETLWWDDLYHWFKKNVSDKKIMGIFDKKYCEWKIKNYPKPKATLVFLTYLIKKPKIIFRKYEFFDLNLFDIFGKNWWTLHLVSGKNRLFRKIRSSTKPHPVC